MAQPAEQRLPPVYLYDQASKSCVLAFVIEWFIPGLGSIYADHSLGALGTWLTMIGGVGLAIAGADRLDHQAETARDRYDERVGQWEMGAGIALMVGGRIFGLVDAWSSASDYNDRLLRELSQAHLSVGLVPIRTREGNIVSPAVRLTF